VLEKLLRLAELEAAERAEERNATEDKVRVTGPEAQIDALSALVQDGERYREAATSSTATCLLVGRFWFGASDDARQEFAGYICGLLGLQIPVTDQEPAPAAPAPEPAAVQEEAEPSVAAALAPVQAPPVVIPEPPDEFDENGIPTFIHQIEGAPV